MASEGLPAHSSWQGGVGGEGVGDVDDGGAGPVDAVTPPSHPPLWTRPPTYGAPPPARGGHVSAVVGSLFIVHGGTFYSGDNRFEYLKDTWALSLESMTWRSPPFSGRVPGARYGHAAAVVDDRVWIFGGKGPSGMLYNDLWCLDVARWVWEMVPSASAAPPTCRFGHSMVAVGNKLLVFGGWDGRTCNGETWLFDVATSTWFQPPLTGISPTPRHGHSTVVDEVAGRMIVFGGCTAASDDVPVYLRDVRELNLRTLAWVRTRVAGDHCTPRQWHAVTCVGNVMVSVGGWSGPRDEAAGGAGVDDAGTVTIPYTSGMGGNALAGPGTTLTVPYGRHADTYFFDMETDEWIQPSVAGKAPGYRYGAAAASVGARVLVWGGWEAGRAHNDLLVLDLSGLTAPMDGDEVAVAGAGGATG